MSCRHNAQDMLSLHFRLSALRVYKAGRCKILVARTFFIGSVGAMVQLSDGEIFLIGRGERILESS